MTRAKRIDANQTEIVQAFRDLNCSVFVTSHVGQGLPDLLVGVSGMTALVEIKDGSKVPSRRKLTALENRFFSEWKGSKPHVIDSVDEVIRLVRYLRATGASLALETR